MRRSRTRAERHGRLAEWLAVWRLRLAGYRILGRRVRTPVGELDIVARRHQVVAVVEVKARGDLAAAAESITPRQRRRIGRAAEAFLAQHPDRARLTLCFDAILAVPWRLPRHLVDAWRA
ncbi:MAG: YraN family protein [Alphaproteobacteria bacterium]|nr:YraN family protein [Alphaproteobacteria bacterium]